MSTQTPSDPRMGQTATCPGCGDKLEPEGEMLVEGVRESLTYSCTHCTEELQIGGVTTGIRGPLTFMVIDGRAYNPNWPGDGRTLPASHQP